jgi:hypothetical protein
LSVDAPNQIGQTKLLQRITSRLTRRANQGHIDIIAEIVTPAPGNRQRFFLFTPDDWLKKFQSVKAVALHFLQFVDGSKII